MTLHYRLTETTREHWTGCTLHRTTSYSDAEWEAAEQAIRERRGYQPGDHVDPWDIEDECADRAFDTPRDRELEDRRFVVDEP